MSNCISEMFASFKPGTMDRTEAITNGAISGFGVITAIALMILQAPLSLSLAVMAFSAVILTGSLLESRGIVYATWITLFAFALAAAILSPATFSYHVVWYA